VIPAPRSFLAALALAGLLPTAVQAQAPPAPPPPPPGWAGSIGGGFAVTRGNADTATLNVGADVLRDAGTDVVFRAAWLLLQGTNDGRSNLDRSQADVRLSYKLSPRLSAFALTTYARDRFKAIDLLIAPTSGFSFQVLPGPRVEWTADASLGFAFEKNRRRNLETSGALQVGEKLAYALGERSRLTHAASGLWKIDDPGDAFYTFSTSLLTSIAGNFDLKTEFLSTYKRKPTDPTLANGDQSVVLSVVYRY
jgi:putative salt-induced outer membrane protein YdiY